MNDMSNASKEKLVADFRQVVADAEELLRLTAGQAGEKMGELRERASANLASARARLADAEAAVVARTKEVARATDDYVHDHPWRSIGVAAGVGLIVGLLIGRR
jgi:ElaB/YqjD/DUF883 family membrane-anchored ribosome-binding protein